MLHQQAQTDLVWFWKALPRRSAFKAGLMFVGAGYHTDWTNVGPALVLVRPPINRDLRRIEIKVPQYGPPASHGSEVPVD